MGRICFLAVGFVCIGERRHQHMSESHKVANARLQH